MARVVTESVTGKDGSTSTVKRYPGRLSRCGVVNGNNRRYGRSVWEAQMKPDSHLRQLMARGAAFGLLEHPADGTISLASPISHVLTEVALEGDEVVGTLTILNTPEGNKLSALIEGGYKPSVSSRGFGSLTQLPDGVYEVQDDYLCEGWDVVFTPSFKDAQLHVGDPALSTILGKKVGESASAAPAQTPAPVSAAPTVVTPAAQVTESVPSNKPTNTQQTLTMKNELISRISAMESINPSQLEATRFASGMSELARLHEDVAAYLAEDNKRSWEAQQLHNRISTVESRWGTAVSKPSTELKRVTENQNKLTRVLKSVVETGLTYKKKLTESRANTAKAKKLVEDVAKRGRSWKALAEKQEVKLRTLEKRYGIACEMLDELAARYNADNTALGKRIIELEFPEAAKRPEIAEALRKARKPKAIAAVRESIEGKRTHVTESAPAAPAPAAPAAAEAAPAPSVVVIESSRGKPGSVSESIALAKRLSTANNAVAAA